MTDELRRALRAIIDAIEAGRPATAQAAYRQVLEHVYEVAHHAILRAFNSHWHGEPHAYLDSDLPAEVMNHILGHKLRDPATLRAILTADSPVAYLRTLSRNAAIDRMRVSEDGSGALQAFEVPDATPSMEHDALAEEGARALGEAYRDLPIDDQILLAVVFVQHAPLTDEQIDYLARKRGVSADVVRGELAARAAAQDEEATTIARDLERRAARILALQRRLHRLYRCHEELDCGGPWGEVTISAQRLRELEHPEAFERATPGERRALLEHLEERLAELCERQRQTRNRSYLRLGRGSADGLARELPAGPRWEEVARIVGVDKPNTVNQRVRRLLLALERWAHEEPDHG